MEESKRAKCPGVTRGRVDEGEDRGGEGLRPMGGEERRGGKGRGGSELGSDWLSVQIAADWGRKTGKLGRAMTRYGKRHRIGRGGSALSRQKSVFSHADRGELPQTSADCD